jgi:hypothetical protein
MADPSVPAPTSTPSSPPSGETSAQTVARSTVEVGHVFGNGGTDGLILYALILATFLMFLALIAVLILSFRAMTRRDQMVADQSNAFADASRNTADALTKLSVAIGTKEAADGTYRTGLTSTLARLEGVLARKDA